MGLLSSILIIITWVLSIFFLAKIITTLKNNKPKSPPGPKPWPIIGNLNLIGSIPHQSFYELSQKYGDIMQLKFGSKPVIIASSREMAKEFLETQGHIWAFRPTAAAAARLTNYNGSGMPWSPHGPFWRQARRVYANELLSPMQLDSYQYIRIEETQKLISRLKKYSLVGEPIVLKEHLLRYTLKVISRMALGKNYFDENKNNSLDMSFEELIEALEEWFYVNGVFNIGDWIPWLDFLDLQGYKKRMKIVHEKTNKFNEYVMNDHRAKKALAGNDFVPKDMVDAFLQISDDPNAEVKVSKDSVKALIQDALTGGIDSSAVTIDWAISELLKKPYLLEKATDELDRVIGRERWVDERDSTQLPFIEAIVKETFRFHPAGTLLAPHFSSEDCNVSGYHIPKDTTLFVNIWSIGRDSRYWDKPEQFLPERFLGSTIDETGRCFELLPFGSGRRMCPGYKLGMKMVKSTLANLLHGFTWKLPDGMKPDDVDMEEEFGLTTHRKIPISAVIEPRLPAHMYEVIKTE